VALSHETMIPLVSWMQIRTRLALLPIAVFVMAPWWRCDQWFVPPPADPAPQPYAPKTEHPIPRDPPAPRPPPKRVTLPDEVVVRAMNVGRPVFVHCFKRAVDVDPTLDSFKVRLHIELDPTGRITTSTNDAPTPALRNCLGRVAYGLAFPAPARPAVVDVPLFYRAN